MKVSLLRYRTRTAFVCAMILAAGSAHSRASVSPPAAEAGASPSVTVSPALPMRFEPNVGQTDERVRYLARGSGYAVFLTGDGATLALSQGGASRPSDETPGKRADDPLRAEAADVCEALRMHIVGASEEAVLSAERELPGKSNYLIGSDSSKWHRDVPTYEAVRYAGVQRVAKASVARGLNGNGNRRVKEVLKGAANTACRRAPLAAYYQAQVDRGVAPAIARVSVARKIAAVALKVWKSGEPFDERKLSTPTA